MAKRKKERSFVLTDETDAMKALADLPTVSFSVSLGPVRMVEPMAGKTVSYYPDGEDHDGLEFVVLTDRVTYVPEETHTFTVGDVKKIPPKRIDTPKTRV